VTIGKGIVCDADAQSRQIGQPAKPFEVANLEEKFAAGWQKSIAIGTERGESSNKKWTANFQRAKLTACFMPAN